MLRLRYRPLPVACVIGLGLMGAISARAETLRGWVSDEQCARGRAGDGLYTGTNPDCAKKCIAGGAKTVLIDSDHKRILVVENPPALSKNIGDYVEVDGSLNPGLNMLHVNSMKMIEKGSASCSRTAHRANTPNPK